MPGGPVSWVRKAGRFFLGGDGNDYCRLEQVVEVVLGILGHVAFLQHKSGHQLTFSSTVAAQDGWQS